jgi:hypothetical protein
MYQTIGHSPASQIVVQPGSLDVSSYVRHCMISTNGVLINDRTKVERALSDTSERIPVTIKPSAANWKPCSFPRSKAAQNEDLVGIGAQFD